MERTTHLLLLLIRVIIYLCLLCETSHHLCMGCKDEEREGLLNFKKSISDPQNLLSSWTGRNCCRWSGVGCDNTTGHVTQLSTVGMLTQNYNLLIVLNGCPITCTDIFDHSLLSLKFLQHLELRYVCFNEISIPKSIGSLTTLKHLDLSYTNFSGSIPPQLGNLTNLQYLNLRYSSFIFSDSLKWISHLSHLQYLDLSWVELTNAVEQLLRNLNSSLVHLDLSNCNMYGPIPDSVGSLFSLKTLTLYDNNFNGSIPESLGRLSRLEMLDLRYNSLQGVVSDSIFANMTKLEELHLSNNNHVVFNLSSTWVPPFQLKSIDLGSCQLGPQFPSWLQTQTSIFDILDISDAGISDVVPNWFWKASSGADYLNISNNQIKGEIPISLNFLRATLIDLSSNQLRGQLPHLNTDVEEIYLDGNSFSGGLQPILNERMRDLRFVVLSQNHLSGEIPSAICNLGGLVALDISLNNLSGQIPKCHINPDSSHEVVNLASNYLHGSIPQWMAAGGGLQVLRLENNSIQGEIPSFLRYCTSMVILDLGENRLTGDIPSWIGNSLTMLVFLRLRSNMLTGTIPPQLSYLTNLQVLDLAQNNLSGSIPHSFGNFTAMAKLNRKLEYIPVGFGFDKDQEDEMFIDVVKGREIEYTNTAYLVMILDLSCNGFSGEIPKEIMELVALQSLNLSRNQLVGEIPDNFGGMVQLEALDLSENHLSGTIPKSMTLLFSLNKLNLSYNNLSGEIPTGNQLQTLTDPSIYASNRDLCGFPLPKCHSDEPSKAPMPAIVAADTTDDSDLFGLYLGMGIGYAVGLWGIWGILLFRDSWRIAYFRFFDDMADKFFLAKLSIRRWILFKLQG